MYYHSPVVPLSSNYQGNLSFMIVISGSHDFFSIDFIEFVISRASKQFKSKKESKDLIWLKKVIESLKLFLLMQTIWYFLTSFRIDFFFYFFINQLQWICKNVCVLDWHQYIEMAIRLCLFLNLDPNPLWMCH